MDYKYKYLKYKKKYLELKNSQTGGGILFGPMVAFKAVKMATKAAKTAGIKHPVSSALKIATNPASSVLKIATMAATSGNVKLIAEITNILSTKDPTKLFTSIINFITNHPDIFSNEKIIYMIQTAIKFKLSANISIIKSLINNSQNKEAIINLITKDVAIKQALLA
jgi:hypothetical protein